MKKEDVLNIVEKCFHGDPPSCSHACPFHLDIRAFCEKANAGRWNTVYKYMRDSLIFPVIVQNICPMTCSSKCQRPLIGDESIDMTLLEDAVLRYAKNKTPIKFAIPPKAESVAVIGAGVAGLSVALNLSQKKYKVTVIDSNEKPLGSLLSHEKAVEFIEDINLQFSVVDCAFEYNRTIETLEQLSEYDAVFVASGASLNDTDFSREIDALLASFNVEYYSTSSKNVFLGGELCGYSKIQSIADSVKIANIIESYLMTGKPLKEKEEKFLPERLHMLPHDGEQSKNKELPANGEYYSEDEAKTEASRCFLCNCSACLDKCEMLASFNKKRPQKLAQEAFADTHVAPPFSSCTLTKQVFSCNECDYCKSVCPVDINLSELFQVGKVGRIEVKTEPKAYHEFWLRDFEFASKQANYIHFPNHLKESNANIEYLFFPGCKLGETNPDYVTKSYNALCQISDTGIALNCCGAPALWAGEKNIFDEHMETLSNIWEEANKPTIIMACTYCEKIFNKYLPDIQTQSLYSILADNPDLLLLKENSPFNSLSDTPAIFDPCASSENQASKAAVRALCKEAEIEYLELEDEGKCCGFGGHMRTANDELYDKITNTRISANDAPYIAYCANCITTFSDKGKECKHILDLILDIDDSHFTTNLEEKRENLITIKSSLTRLDGKGDFIMPINQWDSLSISLDDETQRYMNEKLILMSDIKETIFTAEQDGTIFNNSETGTSLAYFEKPFIVIWVEYIKTGEGEYKIINTYYHRMHPRRDTNGK